MQKLFIVTVLLVSQLAYSASITEQDKIYLLNSSEITYKVEFPLKTVYGKSTQAKGKGACLKDKCDFLIAAAVDSFKSGDTNRDVHMLEVTQATKSPYVTVRLTDISDKNLKKVSADVELNSITHKIPDIDLEVVKDKNLTEVSGKFKIKLSDFKVERPKLLGIAVDDDVEINFKTKWENPKGE